MSRTRGRRRPFARKRGSMKHWMFYPALWAGKLFLWRYRQEGRLQNDRPGMVSMRLCGEFLRDVAKPDLTIAVSGTNGKTTISSMLASVLTADGRSVSYNDWGANHHAGHARCLLDAVDIWNRPTKDVAVIEMDELISPLNVPAIRPEYLILNNLGRDSMLRNANPQYIQGRLAKAAAGSPETTVVVNGDDPLSCFLGEGNRRIRFGVGDLHLDPLPSIAPDCTVCPVCGAPIQFRYRQYRQVGDFFCGKCGMTRPEPEYFVERVDYDRGTLTMREPRGTYTYPLISPSVFNLYDEAAAITLLRDLGIAPEVLAQELKQAAIPASRRSRETVAGVELITQMTKGQNPAAASSVFERIAKDPAPKELVLLLDEVYTDPHKSETAAWIFDTDYEDLNRPEIRKIIVGGARYLDHKVRLLLAGVPREKIVCIRDPFETPKYVDTQGVQEIFVLHDVVFISRGRQVRDKIAEKLRAEREEGAVYGD